MNMFDTGNYNSQDAPGNYRVQRTGEGRLRLEGEAVRNRYFYFKCTAHDERIDHCVLVCAVLYACAFICATFERLVASCRD